VETSENLTVSTVYERSRLSTVFLKQSNIGDFHPSVNCLAHVIDGEQRHLHSGERFHFYARLSNGFDGGCALHAVRVFVDGKLHSHAGERKRVAQRNQVAGFLGSLNARNARNAQHIAFLGGTALNEAQRGGQHDNATGGHAHAFGVGFVGHVHHMGLALRVKVCECEHAEIYNGLT